MGNPLIDMVSLGENDNTLEPMNNISSSMSIALALSPFDPKFD
jgi:hypothetical protein